MKASKDSLAKLSLELLYGLRLGYLIVLPQLGEGTLALNFVIRTTEIPVPQSYPKSRL